MEKIRHRILEVPRFPAKETPVKPVEVEEKTRRTREAQFIHLYSSQDVLLVAKISS